MASLGDGQLNSISVIYENASVYNSTDYLFQLKRVQLITLAWQRTLNAAHQVAATSFVKIVFMCESILFVLGIQ